MLRRKIYILSRGTCQVTRITTEFRANCPEVVGKIISSVTFGYIYNRHESVHRVWEFAEVTATDHRIKELAFSKQRGLRARAQMHTYTRFPTYHASQHVPHRNTSLRRWRRPGWSKDPADTPLSTIGRSLWIRDEFRHVRIEAGKRAQKPNNKFARETRIRLHKFNSSNCLCVAGRSGISERFFPSNTAKDRKKNKLLRNKSNLFLYLR